MKEFIKNRNTDALYVLQNLIVRYTKGKSSSIKEDTAVRILNSIYYAINAYIKGSTNSSKGFSLMVQDDIVKMYESGIEILKKSVLECKELYGEVKENKLHIPNEIYNYTIDTALTCFFESYDIVFAAQDVTCTMDYPLVFDNMNIKGIYYIKQYLEKLKIETEFCNFFTQAAIRKLLRDYGKKYKINIIKAPINVFEILIDQSLFLVLSESSEEKLTISMDEFKRISERFLGKSKEEISLIVNRAFSKIISKFNIKSLKLIGYIKKYENSFKTRFLIACSSGNLYNMVVIDKEGNEENYVAFKKGRKMDNYEFSCVVDEVTKCENVKDKLEIISENVHSLEDYMDILNLECLFGDEYKKVFQSLDDMSLAVLGKNVFYDDLRCNSFSISTERLLLYKDTLEYEWQNYYIDFLLELKGERIRDIEKIIMNIDVGEEL
ncbi:hypothetical protein CLRAG_24150 [Clostridium ragsdalei P11]|uniref:Uncharacterized protein n=1 Tax=Clostridium ragsdalei P11 TaxID=1353534 RepID=A0A1A6ARA7_9CLOT|nr:DUF6179 domain-containing protein [Clostridium ragsdalei]OBR92565.1 hypothetical protein CLRAG_24150 [Clostridium ragsdalei P11]